MSAFECKQYMWREGFGYSKDPQIVGKVLESIEERDGHVTAAAFLEESRPEDSETHSMFEWNDAIAAEKYRLDRARKIITQITYVITKEEDVIQEIELEETTEANAFVPPVKPHSAFVNVNERGRGRVSTTAILVSAEKAMSDETMRKQVLNNSLFEIKMYVNKYRDIVEFAKIFTAIDEVEAEIRKE